MDGVFAQTATGKRFYVHPTFDTNSVLGILRIIYHRVDHFFKRLDFVTDDGDVVSEPPVDEVPLPFKPSARKAYRRPLVEEQMRRRSLQCDVPYYNINLYRVEQNAESLFDNLMQFVADERLAVSTSSPYYDALRYADNELPQIRHYLRDGLLEIDNNLAENAIRPFAVGRRSWLFMCTEDGAQASANIYSLLITAKANGIEPRSYLTEVIRRQPTCVTIEDYEALLPQ